MLTRPCRYCAADVGIIQVNGRTKAVSLVPIPYREGLSGYVLDRYRGWRVANDVWPEPDEILPPHPCAYVEQQVADVMRLEDLVEPTVSGIYERRDTA